MYKMRWRILVLGVTTPGTASADDPLLFATGDITTDTVNPTGGTGLLGSPFTFNDSTGPIITSESAGTSALISVLNKIQKSLGYNVRGEVWGAPVGTAEAGNPDLTSDEKAEKLYVQADTPSTALLLAMARANRKPRAVANHSYTPANHNPEVGVAETTEPGAGG